MELGAVTVTRLIEWTGPVLTVDSFFPDLEHQTWSDNQGWLAPDFWGPADNAHPVTPADLAGTQRGQEHPHRHRRR